MNNSLFGNLIEHFLSLRTEKELKTFMSAILTPKELDEIPKRLEIVRLLKRGMSQRQIADKLGVGIATVTRGSRELQKGNFKDVT